ncbi:MAG: hypothetical protein Q9218_006303 [Villophora microphyllina]
MGRYDFRPLRVHQTATRLVASERIQSVPPWHDVVGRIPPAQTLVRSQPLQHQERPRRLNIKKPSKLFQPQRITYEEDNLRKEFFGDHPWELARPRVVLENDGRDSERKDWSLVSQPDRHVDGESVVQRQVFLLHGNPEKGQIPNPNMTPARAYDQARKEFYETRLHQDIERRIAKEEAMATGAYFGKTVLQVGMQLEDKVFEEWKTWATAEVIKQEQKRAAMYTGVDNESAALSEKGSETEAVLSELKASIPAQGQEAFGGAADNIRIFTEGVEDARHEQQARSHEVGPAVNLKLTVDLSKRNLYAIPDEVIDILKVDVERLQLSHNQICYIPDVFSQCRPLKYLNLRHNLFQEFPSPVSIDKLFSLPQLEILDLSCNEIQKIPEGLGRMRSLRVLSLAKNKIKNIPPCVKDLDTLRMLKLAGNPLRAELAAIVEAKDTYPPYDEATDNEKETFTTSNLKHQLKVEAAARDSGDGSRDSSPTDAQREPSFPHQAKR